MTDERLEEIQSLFWNETTDPESREWRTDLNPEESEYIAKLDKQVAAGFRNLINELYKITNRRNENEPDHENNH